MERVFAVLLLSMVMSVPAWAQTESGSKGKQTPQGGMILNVAACVSVGTSRKFTHAAGFRRFIDVVVLRNLEVREKGGK